MRAMRSVYGTMVWVREADLNDDPSVGPLSEPTSPPMMFVDTCTCVPVTKPQEFKKPDTPLKSNSSNSNELTPVPKYPRD